MFLGLEHFEEQMDGHITGQLDDLTVPICAPFLRIAQTQLVRNSLKSRLFVWASVWTETRICVIVKKDICRKQLRCALNKKKCWSYKTNINLNCWFIVCRTGSFNKFNQLSFCLRNPDQY